LWSTLNHIKGEAMKRAGFYVRVSTLDQNPQTQLRELREYAERRGLSIAGEYVDHGFGGAKARRPALDRMLEDARRRRFDTLIVWSCDRLARSTKHFLQVLDELDSCGVQFVSLREAFDTSGALGRAFLGIVAVLGEMERALLIERVRSGMARARAEGRQIGRARLDVNREQVVRDRRSGMSLTQVAKKHRISRASVCRLVKASASPDAAAPALAGKMVEQASAAGGAR
jgi:DNA invertase Pin-like site-specific DNA recombinase